MVRLQMGSACAPQCFAKRPAGWNQLFRHFIGRLLPVFLLVGALAAVSGHAEAPDAEKSSYLSSDDGCPTIPLRDLYRLKATYESCPTLSDSENFEKTVDLFKYLPEGCGECIYQLRLGIKANIPVTGGTVEAANVHGKTISFATGTPGEGCPMVVKTTSSTSKISKITKGTLIAFLSMCFTR